MAHKKGEVLHVVFVPYFTPSHMIPLVDTARLFASHGVKVSIITTHYNALLFQSSIDHATELGHEIFVNKLKFPSAEVGIPEGIENFSAATGHKMAIGVFLANSSGYSWLPIGFEEKTLANNKGLIVRGWVPQLKILNHPATGAFMTHCGCNSILESLTAGVPMLTWPLFAEQFYNEKLLEVSGCGVGVGAEVWHPSFDIKDTIIKKEKIEASVKMLMNTSKESEKMRSRAKDVEAMVKRAVEEGGSSYNHLTALIQEIKCHVFGISEE